MKRAKIIIPVFLFLLFSQLMAAEYIKNFYAKSSGENIELTWQAVDGADIREFVILRGMDRNSMMEIARISSDKGNALYSYLDENAYKTNDSFYLYQIKVIDINGKEVYWEYVSVTHSVSSVKRTWGSIKALFR